MFFGFAVSVQDGPPIPKRFIADCARPRSELSVPGLKPEPLPAPEPKPVQPGQPGSLGGRTGDLSGPATIPAANVAVQLSTNANTLITGTANTNVLVNAAGTLSTAQPLNAPVTFIERATAANAGKIGKYRPT